MRQRLHGTLTNISGSEFSQTFTLQYKATDFVVPGAGTLEIKFTPTDSTKESITYKIFDFMGGGVAMGMYNTDEVIMNNRHS